MTSRQDEQVTLCGIAAVILTFVVVLAIASGCSALKAAAPSLLDAADAALRAELQQAEGERAEAVRRGLDLVALTRQAQADAVLARVSADAQAEEARAAAEDAAEQAENEARAREVAMAYASAAEASRKAADAQARARDAQERVTALEALVRELAAERVERDAGAGGGE